MKCKPATFNPCSADLFNKSPEHIDKEMRRRGLSYYSYECQAEKVAGIIWKDAYDAGVNDARHGLAENPISTPKPTTEPETRDYLFCNERTDTRYRVTLTKDQYRLMEWLCNRDLLENEFFFEEWGNDVVEVGRI